MQQDRDMEWRSSLQRQDEAWERSKQIQAEIEACIRRRQALPRALLRAADEAASELAEAKARVSELIRWSRA